MLNPADILEKAQKNVERQIVLLKEELAAKESAKNNCRQNGSIPDMSEYVKKSELPKGGSDSGIHQFTKDEALAGTYAQLKVHWNAKDLMIAYESPTSSSNPADKLYRPIKNYEYLNGSKQRCEVFIYECIFKPSSENTYKVYQYQFEYNFVTNTITGSEVSEAVAPGGGSSVEHFTCPVIALLGNDVPAGRTVATFDDINTAFKAGKTCILDVCRTIQATGTVTIQEYRLTSSCVDASYLFGCITTQATSSSEMSAVRVDLGNTWTCNVDTSFKTYSLHAPNISHPYKDITFYSKPESVTPTSVEEIVWFDSINVKPELTLTYLDGSDIYHQTTTPFWDAVYEYSWTDEETGLTWNCKDTVYEFKVNSSYTPGYSMPGSKFNFSMYMYVGHSVCENGEEENYCDMEGYVRRDQMNTIDSTQIKDYSFNEVYYLLFLGNLRIINQDRCKQDFTQGEFYVKSVICNSESPDEDHDFSLILCSDVKTGFTNEDSLQARGNPYITVSKWDYNGTTKTWDTSPEYYSMNLAGVTNPTSALNYEWKMALFVAHGGILANYSHPYNGAYRFSQVLAVTSYPQNSDYYFDCIWVDNSDQTIPAQQWPMYYERVVVHYDENGEITTPEGSSYGVKTLYKATLTHTVYP